MKHLLPKLLTLLLCLISAIPIFSQKFTYEGINYHVSSVVPNTVEVWTNENLSGDIVIPSTVTYNDTKYTVTSLYEGAFKSCTGITSVSLPRTITKIGSWAFAYCSGLTSVVIPDWINTIGYAAYYGCYNLTSIYIPSSVTTIGDHAFAYCNHLPSIYIPSSVTSIGEAAFFKCIRLASVNIPSSITKIEEMTFQGCSSLTSVRIPESVTSIGMEAFLGCSGLLSLTLPNSITKIEAGTFHGCSSLPSLVIPDNVTEIGEGAFYICSELKELTLPAKLETLGGYVFGDSPKLVDVYYRASEPIETTPDLFEANMYDKATLHVPSGTKAKFEETIPWKYFYKITDSSASGIEDMPVADGAEIDRSEPYEVYDLNGIRISATVDNLTPGIYVLRQGSNMQKIAVQ